MPGERSRDPRQYIHGTDFAGPPLPVCIVPARVAAILERHANLQTFRVTHRGEDAEVDDVLMALHRTALYWRSSATGTTQAAPPEPTAEWITTTQAATILGIGERAVRKACAHGHLKADHHGNRWRIHREDLAHYKANQNRTRT